MARKKTNEQEVFVPAPLADAKWINTPFAYARLSKDLTLMQQTVLLKVSDFLQDYISQFFQDKRNLLPDDPNSLFTPEVTMKMPRLEIRLSDFGIDKSRYGEIHLAADVVSKVRIKAPNIMADGTPNGYKMFPVFDEIVVPKTDESAPDDEKYNYRTGVMYASINPKVAAYAFNMRLGYVNHPVKIAADSNQMYSPRVYFMIKHYLQKGKSFCVIPYDKIREELGMKVPEYDADGNFIYDEKGNQSFREQYQQFSRFSTYVLDKAKEDIERMASLNLIDITFSYDPIYNGRRASECPDRKTRGNPDAIRFDIELTALGKYHKLPRATRAAMKDETAETRRRGRPKKQAEGEMSGQQTIDFDQPAILAGDRVGEWQQLVKEYGDGPSAQLLGNAECLGTIDGAFALRMPDRVSVDAMTRAAVDDDRLHDLLVRYVGRRFKTIQVM